MPRERRMINSRRGNGRKSSTIDESSPWYERQSARQRSRSILLTIPNDRRERAKHVAHRRGCAVTYENCWGVPRVFERMRDLNLRSLNGRGHPRMFLESVSHFLLDIRSEILLAPTSPLLRLSAPFEGKRGQLYVRKSPRSWDGLPSQEAKRTSGSPSCRRTFELRTFSCLLSEASRQCLERRLRLSPVRDLACAIPYLNLAILLRDTERGTLPSLVRTRSISGATIEPSRTRDGETLLSLSPRIENGRP